MQVNKFMTQKKKISGRNEPSVSGGDKFGHFRLVSTMISDLLPEVGDFSACDFTKVLTGPGTLYLTLPKTHRQF